MYNKIKSLEKLLEKRLNVHEFEIADTYEQVVSAVERFDYCCTVRVDDKDNSNSLPFYIFSSISSSTKVLDKLYREGKVTYKYIIANGLKYDPIQDYNLVARIDKNGDFMLEASNLKIPLRNMYHHQCFSAYGNISEELSEWIIINQLYGIDRTQLRRVMQDLYTKEIYGRWLEATVYPQYVGILKQNIIFWQVC